MQYLSNKEKKQLSDKLPKGYEIEKKDEIIRDKNIILKNKEPFLIVIENRYLPHLKSVSESDFKSVYVDKGAIPFILKGADLMRPGIQRLDEGFETGDVVLIKDENHNITIAIGFALINSDEIQKQTSGKSLKIYHFVSDEYY